MEIRLPRLAAALAVLALAAASAAAGAAELKVFTTIALTDAWHELKPKFEARGHKLNLVFGTSGALGKQIAGGEAGDVFVSTTASIDGLEKAGKIVSGSGKVLARSGMGVAVRKGAPKPDISTPEAFRAALLAAKSVAYSDPAGGGASGAHMVKVLERLGIAQQVNARAKLGRGVPNGEFVARGESDLAIQQTTELLPVAGIEIVGPLPGDLQLITEFSAGLLASSKSPDAARALLDFLKSTETAALLKAKGFDDVR